MVFFPNKLVVSPSDSEDGAWIIEEPFICLLDGSDKNKVEISPGFITDFASIPRFLWWLYPPYHPHYGKAAILHDALYAGELLPKLTCDELFREGMITLGCSWPTRNIMYYAVKRCGFAVWNTHTLESIDKAREFVKHELNGIVQLPKLEHYNG